MDVCGEMNDSEGNVSCLCSPCCYAGWFFYFYPLGNSGREDIWKDYIPGTGALSISPVISPPIHSVSTVIQPMQTYLSTMTECKALGEALQMNYFINF